MCYIRLHGGITFQCGHFRHFPQEYLHHDACPFMECLRPPTLNSPIYDHRNGPGTPIPFPCPTCIHEERYTAIPADGPIHTTFWVLRREAQEEQPVQQRLAPAQAQEGRTVQQQQQQQQEEVKQEEREEATGQAGSGQTREGAKRDMKEDIRADVQVILEDEIKSLMATPMAGNLMVPDRIEWIKGYAMRRTYWKIRQVLKEEMYKVWRKVEEILKEDTNKVAEKIKQEIKEEVKEEVGVKVERE
ncbi:hypothetical protein QBC32DRAFT_327727 [Pseudoneurospora amorphoporcata]|uniref:Uncharacterized protein n=1 Tax=Pseudoneurospora amorphoporcata TaxID=241081 RepID=A0AAN6NQT8_9PEZI|nr:hypothetical protein QBC32DRAFT_327727 [Pseudoneurospora amorphoporcata]